MNDKLIKIGDKTYKEAQVIMLPTDNIPKDGQFIGKHYPTNTLHRNSYHPQHLYIVTSEEIKDCDFCIDTDNTVYHANSPLKAKIATSKNCPKVIASTDTSLLFYPEEDYNGRIKKMLPKPSNDFIKKYCELNGDIKDVLVEYILDCDFCDNTKEVDSGMGIVDCHKCNYKLPDEELPYKLKITPDNTISIIKNPKDKIYSREELENYMLASALAFIGYNDEANTEEDIKDWIKTHIK